jgi:hypothetical protein
MGITAKFGDLPGHEFHGNQWTLGTTLGSEAMHMAEHARQAEPNNPAVTLAHEQSRAAHYTYGAGPKASAHAAAAKAHIAAAKTAQDYYRADIHHSIAAKHTEAAGIFKEAAKTSPRGFVKSGWKPGSLDGPYRSSGPLKDARDAMLKGKFGRNVVRQLTKIGVRY